MSCSFGEGIGQKFEIACHRAVSSLMSKYFLNIFYKKKLYPRCGLCGK